MIYNVHEREYPVPAARLGELLDRVAEPDSPLWPARRWSPMVLDRPLGVGAEGGNGPISYRCTGYLPGRRAQFTLTWPAARGTHILSIRAGSRPGTGVLRYALRARPRGLGHLLWPLMFRWLHDACLRDMLDQAGCAVGHPPAERARWSPWIRLLRRLAPREPRTPYAHSLKSASST